MDRTSYDKLRDTIVQSDLEDLYLSVLYHNATPPEYDGLVLRLMVEAIERNPSAGARLDEWVRENTNFAEVREDAERDDSLDDAVAGV